MYGVPEEERLTAQQVLTAWERQLAELVLSENKTDDGRLFICRSVPFQDEQQYWVTPGLQPVLVSVPT